MTEKNELKARSFRITEDVANKIKAITEHIGGNQQEAFAKLIEAYEMQKGKTAMPERAAQIADFERYISCINRLFVSALEDNYNLSATIRTDYDAQLNSKDQTIQDLQKALAEKSNEVTTILEENKNIHAQLRQSEKEKEQIKNELAALKEANTSLTQLNINLKTQASNELSKTTLQELNLKHKEEILKLKEQYLKELEKYTCAGAGNKKNEEGF